MFILHLEIFQYKFQLVNKNDINFFRVQKQDNNLEDEFSELKDILGDGVEWANEAMGKSPSVSNLWIGD